MEAEKKQKKKQRIAYWICCQKNCRVHSIFKNKVSKKKRM